MALLKRVGSLIKAHISQSQWLYEKAEILILLLKDNYNLTLYSFSFRGDQKESKFDPTATRHPEAELNEEDIFRMKSLSLSRTNALSEQAGQSAVSLVDSASNFDERAAQNDNDDEQDGGEFGDHEVNEQNEEPVQVRAKIFWVFGFRKLE